MDIIRCHVGGIRFQEETFEGGLFNDIGGVLVGGVGYYSRDADEGVGKVGEDRGGEVGRVGETVDVKVGLRRDVFVEDAEDIVVCFSCVD